VHILCQIFCVIFTVFWKSICLRCFCFVVAAFISMFCIFMTYSTSYSYHYILMDPWIHVRIYYLYMYVCMYVTILKPQWWNTTPCRLSTIAHSVYSHLETVTSIGNQRTRHAIVTCDLLTWSKAEHIHINA